MGSSSSKPQQYTQAAPPIPTAYRYPPQMYGQFGYYIQQVGDDPSQVQAIPGYYYYPGGQPLPTQASHKRHHSAPMLSAATQSKPTQTLSEKDDKTVPASSPEAEPPPASEDAAEPAVEASAAAAGDNPAGSSEDKTETDQPPLSPTPEAPPETQTAAPAPPPAPQKHRSLPAPPKEARGYPRRAQTDGTASTGVSGYYAAPVASVAYKPHLRAQYHPRRDPPLRPPRPHEELVMKDLKPSGSGKGPFRLLRSLTLPSLSSGKARKMSGSPVSPLSVSHPYPYATTRQRARIPAFPDSPLEASFVGAPIMISQDSPLHPTSLHKVLYKKKLYPTAAHLFEAQRFLKHRPDLAERIRTCGDDAAEMAIRSWKLQKDGLSRPDWALVWRDKMDEVLYLKFVQHPDLRAELMATGYAPLLNGTQVHRADVEGANELGKALVRLRERLRREGAR